MNNKGGVIAYIAVSVAFGVVALIGYPEIAVAIAIPGYTGLTATLHSRVGKVQESIGPVNGENLRDLLERLIELDSYTHIRNHDILGALSPTNANLAVSLIELKTVLAHVEQMLEEIESHIPLEEEP